MLHSDVSISKMSRRSILLSIASTAGLALVGCSNAAQGAGLPPTPTPTPATPTPLPATPTPTVGSSAQPGTTLVTYKGHTSAVISIAWSPDSQFIASGDQNGAVQVWRATTSQKIFASQNPQRGNTLLAWSASGKYIASTTSSSISIWNASNGALINTYNAQSKGVTALAFSPDSQRLATSSFDKTVQIWQATTGTHILTYNGHNTPNGVSVNSLSWSPDGTQIVSSSSLLGGSGAPTAPSLKVWNSTTGKDILVYNTTNSANAVAWSPNGTFIASEEYLDGAETVQIWSAENGRGLALAISDDSVQHISWSPNSNYVALSIGSYQALLPDTRVEVRSATGGSYKLTYSGHQPNVRNVAWSPDGSRIASCSDDKTVQIWQAPV